MRRDHGFSLIEVLVALSLLATAVWAAAQVAAYTARSSDIARRITLGTELADDKLNQLRGLSWSQDESGSPVTDEATDLTVHPERSSGGTGLRASPPGALDRNVAGYCDFLDGQARLLDGGAAPPADTAFVRRWSVTPLDAAPAAALVIQVRLLSPEAARRNSADPAGLTVTTLRSRLAP